MHEDKKRVKDEKKHNKLVAKKARAAAISKANKLAEGEETKVDEISIQSSLGVT